MNHREIKYDVIKSPILLPSFFPAVYVAAWMRMLLTVYFIRINN